MNFETICVYVVIPAFNEERSIERVIGKVRSVFPASKIAVVNDGSRDETAKRAEAAGAAVLDLPFNCGYGVALHTGLLWAYREGAEFVLTQDADGQHDAGEAVKLLEPVVSGEADLVLGSRYLENAVRYRVPISRRFGSWLFARTVSSLTGQPLTDPTTGFQVMNRKTLRVYSELADFPARTPDADLILYAKRSGCRILEKSTAMYEDESNDSMHGFLKSLFYVPNMLVSLLGMLLIKTPPNRGLAQQ
jgi:glycosyltransferase involved in cell wall biosynthesis